MIVFAGNGRPLWLAIVILERGLRRSPSNFHFKLLLIALYAKLGACAPCCQLFESMEIKHIQHDALGYGLYFLILVLCEQVGSFGFVYLFVHPSVRLSAN